MIYIQDFIQITNQSKFAEQVALVILSQTSIVAISLRITYFWFYIVNMQFRSIKYTTIKNNKWEMPQNVSWYFERWASISSLWFSHGSGHDIKSLYIGPLLGAWRKSRNDHDETRLKCKFLGEQKISWNTWT